MLFQIHGVIKELAHAELGKEPFAYHQSQWRSTLGIKPLSKKEKQALIPEAQAVKGERYKTYHKHLCDIKHRVIDFVNNEFDIDLTFEENDIADAIGLIVAHVRVV